MNLTKHWAAQLDDYVIDLAWSPDDAQLAAASASGPVGLFGGTDGAKQHELPGHDNGTNCLAFPATPSAAAGLATGGQDGAVKFWDPVAGQHTATAELGNAWVEHLVWRPSSKLSATGGQPSAPSTQAATPSAPVLLAAAGKTLVALRADGSVAHAFAPAPKTISAMALPPAGGCVAVAHFGGVELWDTDDFVLQKKFAYSNGIHALVWSPDGRWLVSGNQDPSVHLWIPETDTELHMSGYEGKVKHLTFDHTSHWLATSGGRDVCVWDCSGDGPEGREPAMLPHESPICAVAFQRHHGLLASASSDGVVQLWSPDRRAPLRATVRMPAAATKLAWSADDRFLAIGTEKGHVFVLRCEG